MGKTAKMISLIALISITFTYFIMLSTKSDGEDLNYIKIIITGIGATFLTTSIYAMIKSLSDYGKSLEVLKQIEANQNKIIFLLRKNIENKQ